jgi:archaellum biogenesis ATPase FlaH
MNAAQIQLYWSDKVNQVALSFDSPFEEEFLLEGLRESIKEWDTEPDIGMPFYQSRMMSKICGGLALGNLYLHGGFGGKGKTSMTFNKVIMSCIENKEKLVVIANEQSINEFKKMLFVTAMGVGTKETINRQRLNEGNFTEEEKAKLDKALQWIDNLCNNEKLIAFVFMEHYTMSNVRKVLTHYANRGYKRVIIDTGKPGEEKSSKQRWEQFTEDMVDLYKMTRPNGGGLNLSVWVNVQLADSALGQRYLDEYALGVAKAAKNEASVFFLSRPLWDDEYKGEKYELTVNRRTYNDITEEWQTEEFKLEPVYTDSKGNKYANHYYLLFTAKNRRGQSNDTGQEVLVMNWVPNSNIWFEVGLCRPIRTRSYAQ